MTGEIVIRNIFNYHPGGKRHIERHRKRRTDSVTSISEEGIYEMNQSWPNFIISEIAWRGLRNHGKDCRQSNPGPPKYEPEVIIIRSGSVGFQTLENIVSRRQNKERDRWETRIS